MWNYDIWNFGLERWYYPLRYIWKSIYIFVGPFDSRVWIFCVTCVAILHKNTVMLCFSKIMLASGIKASLFLEIFWIANNATNLNSKEIKTWRHILSGSGSFV